MFDNQYFLAADEDFNPYRADKFFVDDQERPAEEVGGGQSAASLPDQTLSGKVVYGGYGCPGRPDRAAEGGRLHGRTARHSAG